MDPDIVVPVGMEVAMATLLRYILEAEEAVDDGEDCPGETEAHVGTPDRLCPGVLSSQVDLLWRRNVRQSFFVCL
jgi:hypothetical protein